MSIVIGYSKLPTNHNSLTCIPQDYCHKIQCIALANSSHFQRNLQSNLGQSKEQTTRYLILKKKKKNNGFQRRHTPSFSILKTNWASFTWWQSSSCSWWSRVSNIFLCIGFLLPHATFFSFWPPLASQTYMGIFLNNASKFYGFAFVYF